MKKIILSILMSVSIFGFSQTYVGTTTFGTTQIETNYCSAKDSHGNIYTVGFYSGTITFGSTTVSYKGGNADGYLTKHDANGNPVWIKSFGGTADDVAIAVTVDSSDNIILTGYFQGAGSNSFDADPSDNIYLLSQPAAILSRDCFIVKLDSNGDFVWAKQVSNPTGGALNEDSKTIKTDAAGNVYVAGSYRYADFDTSSSTQYILSAGGTNSVNGFLLKLTPSGDFVWVKTFDSPNNSVVESIDLDTTGNFYVAGRYDGTVDLDPSTTTTQNSPATAGSYDQFLVKLTSAGDFSWGKTFGGSGSDTPKFVKVIGTNVYMGGSITGTLDLDPNSGDNTYTTSGVGDGYISKFDQDGNYSFSYVVGGSSASDLDEMYRVAEGPNGNLFISGTFSDTADVDFGTSVNNIVSNGSLDVFALEITPTGQYVNHVAFGGSLKEAFSKLEFSIDNHVFLIGSFNSGTIDFDPYAGINTLSNNASGSYDVYFTTLAWPNIALANTTFANDNINVYPNPVKDNLVINSIENVKSYTICNSLGQVVAKGTIQPTINFSNFSNGVYILSLETDKGVSTQKIIKE